MAYDGSLNFDTKIDTKGFNKDINSISKSIKRLGALIAVTFGTRALINFGKEAISIASKLEEIQNVVEVAFGEMSGSIDAFADTAIEKFGLSELSAKQYASQLGAMGSSMGFAAEQNADMAKEITGLVGDFASFYDIRQDMAATALNAIYTGETETLKRYGILITEVNLQEFARRQGITKTMAKMTQQEKVMLRYNFVMKATENAQGDFLRTQESWANQTRILSERWKQFLGLIGKNLIAVFTPAINMLNNLLVVLIAATEQFNAFYSAVTGKQIEQQNKVTTGIEGSVSEQDALTDAVKGTNKELSKSLAGFDDINVLQEKTADVAAEPLAIASTITTEVAEPKEQEVSPVFEKMLKLLQPLQDISFDKLNASLGRLGKALKPFVAGAFAGLEYLYLNILVPLADFVIQRGLPALIDLIAASLTLISDWAIANQTTMQNIGVATLVFMGAWKVTQLLAFIQLSGGLVATLGNISKAIHAVTVAKIADKWQTIALTALYAKDFVVSLAASGVALVKNTIAVVASTTAKIAAKIAQLALTASIIVWNVIAAISTVLTTAFGAAIAFLTSPIGLVIIAIAALIAALIWLVKNWDKVKEVAGIVWDFIVEKWSQFAGFIKDKVIDPVANFFTGLWEGIKETFVSVFNFIKTAFKNYINGWIGIIESFFNFFIGGINSLIDRVNTFKIDVPDWVPKIGGSSFGFGIPNVSNIKMPRLATGAVIPPNAEFAAILGDQKSGNNIEAPENLIRQIIREEGGGKTEVIIKFEGTLSELARIMKPELDEESKRKGQTMKVVPA